MRSARVYFHLLLGAFGGLTGWYLMSILIRGDAAGTTPLMQAAQGAMLGGLIGLGSGAYDGLAVGSATRVVRFGGLSAVLGLVAGGAALPLIQLLYGNLADGNSTVKVLVGFLCWILFGLMIGVGEGFSKGAQTWKAVAGGALGGAIGGGIYEAIGRSASGSADPAGYTLLAVALAILGGCIAASVAFVSVILTDASLTIEDGKSAGTEVNLSKYVHKDLGTRRRSGIIGSSQWDANIYLPGDPGVLPLHATIGYVDGAPTLTASREALERKAVTEVNGRPIKVWPLSDGDRLRIGKTTMIYRQRRK